VNAKGLSTIICYIIDEFLYFEEIWWRLVCGRFEWVGLYLCFNQMLELFFWYEI